jgi:UDP-N-acetyl-D-mannosaminuronate dehydrogenase
LLEKNVIAGLGEIGMPIFKLISSKNETIGYDINEKLIDKKLWNKYEKLKTSFLHICIPFSDKFVQNVVKSFEQFEPKVVVIHSTISPGTSKKIQNKIKIPVIYSATRGVHKRMLSDLKRYTKFFAVESDIKNSKKAAIDYAKLMKKCGVKYKKLSNPLTLELAKIVVDTSYYGWLITYSQISKMIADKNNVDFDEMWSFSDEIHKFLGNRPKMFPGFIGGHCVIPNLELIDNNLLNLINDINLDYAKYLKKNKS